MTRQHGLHERGFGVLSDAQIARHRAMMTSDCIHMELAETRRVIAISRRENDPEELLYFFLTRAKGLQVCRRLLDGPEKCAKAPGSVMRER